MKRRLLDRTLGRYMLVNLFCWSIGTGVMFLLYNLHIGGYWLASASNYLIGGTLGYILNRRFTFHSHSRRLVELAKYIAHMLVCYFIAYTVAPKLCAGLITQFGLHAAGNVALTVGMIFFTILNYFGQRYLVFRRAKQPAGTDDAPRG